MSWILKLTNNASSKSASWVQKFTSLVLNVKVNRQHGLSAVEMTCEAPRIHTSIRQHESRW